MAGCPSTSCNSAPRSAMSPRSMRPARAAHRGRSAPRSSAQLRRLAQRLSLLCPAGTVNQLTQNPTHYRAQAARPSPIGCPACAAERCETVEVERRGATTAVGRPAKNARIRAQPVTAPGAGCIAAGVNESSSGVAPTHARHQFNPGCPNRCLPAYLPAAMVVLPLLWRFVRRTVLSAQQYKA